MAFEWNKNPMYGLQCYKESEQDNQIPIPIPISIQIHESWTHIYTTIILYSVQLLLLPIQLSILRFHAVSAPGQGSPFRIQDSAPIKRLKYKYLCCCPNCPVIFLLAGTGTKIFPHSRQMRSPAKSGARFRPQSFPSRAWAQSMKLVGPVV